MSLYDVESLLLNILIAGTTPERMEQAVKLSLHLIRNEMNRVTLDCNGQKLSISKTVADRFGKHTGDSVNEIEAEALLDADGTHHELTHLPKPPN